MSSENVIEINSISKCYFLYNKPQDRLKQMIFRGRRKYYTEFWALNNLSFNVKKGECLGIIGRNGAGMSTLLQIISGIITPTSGSINIKGKVAALLELGTGFNPEFTGKENVFLNGSILGLSQDEITALYDDILAFADIGDFINQPVKTYSSGMLVRLAFAVAVHVDPEILIIDEALSVGDAKFQAKCFRKFQDFRDQKKTILFVTHATEQIVRHCDYAMLIEGGTLKEQGDPLDVTNKYLSLIFDTKPSEKNKKNGDSASQKTSAEKKQETDDILKVFLEDKSSNDNCLSRPGYNKSEHRWGDRNAEIIDYMLCDETKWHINHFNSGAKADIYFKVKFNQDIAKPVYGLTVKTPDGITVYGSNSNDLSNSLLAKPQKSGDIIAVKFSLNLNLNAGHFLVSLGVAEETNDNLTPLDRRYDLIEIYVTHEQKIYGITDLDMSFDML